MTWADCLWNPDAYDPDKSWRRALAMLAGQENVDRFIELSDLWLKMRTGLVYGEGLLDSFAEYDKALAILREGRYAEATAAFNRFLADHPGSPYADNASYWLGETYYVTRDFDRAMSTFSKLVEFHPQSPKVSDSRLKIGFIHYENKDWPAARQELKLVVDDYPGTTAARLASDRLKRMQKDGH